MKLTELSDPNPIKWSGSKMKSAEVLLLFAIGTANLFSAAQPVVSPVGTSPVAYGNAKPGAAR